MKILSLAFISLAVLFGQGRSTPQQRYEMFQNYLIRRAAEVTRRNLQDVRTLADWKKRRPKVRRQVLDMLGLSPMPARTPLQARITRRFDRDGYHVENIVFQSMPGLYVTGNLYVPSKPAAGSPRCYTCAATLPGPQAPKSTTSTTAFGWRGMATWLS